MASSRNPDEVFRASPGRTHYTRLIRLLISGGTTILIELFDSIHPPAHLSTVLKSPTVYSTLNEMKRKKILTLPQWKILFPSPGTCGQSKTFDITLLCKLFREICNLPAPATGWDSLPIPTDLSFTADLARIKYFRNEIYGHVNGDMELRDEEFVGLWNEIKDALVRIIKQYAPSGSSLVTEWENAIKKLLTAPLTHEDEIHLDELQNLYREDMEVKKTLKETKRTAEDTRRATEEIRRTAEKTRRATEETRDLLLAMIEKGIPTEGLQQTGVQAQQQEQGLPLYEEQQQLQQPHNKVQQQLQQPQVQVQHLVQGPHAHVRHQVLGPLVQQKLPAMTLTREPWRNVINWDESVEDLLQYLIKVFPPGACADSKTPVFNILLTGIVASGKSAFVNSIYSMFARRIVNRAEAGGSARRVLTEQYCMYGLRNGSDGDPLPWKIADVPGIVPPDGVSQIKNILQIVDGHVPEGYKFAIGETFDSESPEFINKPSSSNKVHCAAIVMSADYSYRMPMEGKRLLQKLRRGLRERGIPTYVILTNIDIVCQEVREDLRNVYHSVSVRDLVCGISKMLLNLPQNDILPVVNYAHQIELENNMDILLLHAFSQLIGAKERKCKNMKNEIVDFVPVTKSDMVLPFHNIILLGQIGSGKSTFFNGINAIFTNRMCTTKAEAGELAFSLTKEFRMYEIIVPGKEKVLSTRICDTFGLKEKTDDDTDVRNVLSAINGHVPDKYTFTDEEFHQDSPGYIPSPDLANKAHCVCIVIDAGKVTIMHDNVWRKLRSVYTAVTNRGIPAKILLMKIDLVLGDNEIIENIDKNKKVLHVKELIQKKLGCDVKQEDIFPIKNYVQDIEFDVEMDTLLLGSLLHMLKCAQKYLENKEM